MAKRDSGGKSDVAKLVERQMRNWELARAQRPATEEPDGAPDVQHFVTISRVLGAGGEEVAQALGERLNWPVFDKQILQAMSGDDQIRRRLFELMDERDVGWLEKTLRWIVQGDFQKDDYFHRMSEAVLAIARKGPAVFLGRGVDLVLPEQRGLRVRVVASPLWCAQRYAARMGISVERAHEEAGRINGERADFIQHHFAREFDDAARHDMVLNRERLSMAGIVDLIVAALRIRGIIS